MIQYGYSVPEAPKNRYQEEAAAQMLSAAESYLANADRLVYSFGSKTFLSGYALYDRDFQNRGNIDCSTLVLLALAGIPYDESPYASGTVKGLRPKPVYWTEKKLVDFSSLPESFTGIAERIGRPYLAGPKGLDLEKASLFGISLETLGEEIKKSGVGRLSAQIARYYLERGECYSDPVYREPGDIVFFLSSGFFTEGEKTFRAEADVSHVGIISEDRTRMINSSGSWRKESGRENPLPAVMLSPVFGSRKPAFFARPAYGLQ